MKNGIIIFLTGIIIVLIGVLYFGEGKGISLISDEGVSRGEKMESTDGSEASTAVPITSGAPLQQTLKPSTSTAPSTSPFSIASGVTIVTSTDDRFLPPCAEVEAVKIVRFGKDSSKPMWVTSFDHTTATEHYYPEFDEGKSASPGETYTFLFSKVAVWGYKNLNNDEHLGAVSVLKQK